MRSRDFGRRSQCEAQPPGVRGHLTAPRRRPASAERRELSSDSETARSAPAQRIHGGGIGLRFGAAWGSGPLGSGAVQRPRDEETAPR
jgi:hypothetical protein